MFDSMSSTSIDDAEKLTVAEHSMTAEVILRVTYGINIEPKDDPYIKIAECAQQGFTIAAVPGAFLVDSFPILKYVPEWFPGAGFKRKAKRWAEATAIMRHKPYDTAKKMRVRTVQCNVTIGPDIYFPLFEGRGEI